MGGFFGLARFGIHPGFIAMPWFLFSPQLKFLQSRDVIGRTFRSLPCQKVQARGTVCPNAAVNLKTHVTESCFLTEWALLGISEAVCAL